MQKVIASVQQKYSSQVQTIFYDVWTKEGKPYADIYKINLIPVQVFLDDKGKEPPRRIFSGGGTGEIVKNKRSN